MTKTFVKVAAAIPVVKIADCKANAKNILELIDEAESKKVEIVCFPELCITSYTAADLFFSTTMLENAEKALGSILEATAQKSVIFILGMPIDVENRLFNTAVVCQKGKILLIIPKTYIPNNNEFYEHRWFSSGIDEHRTINVCGQQVVFADKAIMLSDFFGFSVEICEDLWSVTPPSSEQAIGGSHIIFNLSASNEIVGKNEYRKKLVEVQSGRCNAGYVYVSSGFGESSTDLLFASSAIIAENGSTLNVSKMFEIDKQLVISDIDIEKLKSERRKNQSFKFKKPTDTEPYIKIGFNRLVNKNFRLDRKIEKYPFVPPREYMDERCNEIFNIQVNALATRIFHSKINRVIIGISGGLDSALALLVAVAAFDKLGIRRKNIVGITMPGFGTTSRTKNNSCKLMNTLGIEGREISIEKSVLQHFSDIGHDPKEHDTTYENSQARERTQILMDVANKENGFVIGTGDMSELALGWCTYNGDHMSMYAVNSGIPKTLVKYLIEWIATAKSDKMTKKILLDIVDTPISPELLPNSNDKIVQKTENVVGPYELHDFFLYYFIRFGFSTEKILFLAQNAFDNYSKDEIKKYLEVFTKRFFMNQYKRSCVPDGVKVGSINLSPRGDWRMPSDASYEGWTI